MKHLPPNVHSSFGSVPALEYKQFVVHKRLRRANNKVLEKNDETEEEMHGQRDLIN